MYIPPPALKSLQCYENEAHLHICIIGIQGRSVLGKQSIQIYMNCKDEKINQSLEKSGSSFKITNIKTALFIHKGRMALGVNKLIYQHIAHQYVLTLGSIISAAIDNCSHHLYLNGPILLFDVDVIDTVNIPYLLIKSLNGRS